ncbi:MAG: nucleoside-triphosphatase [Anaerolineales bacterium]
MALITDKGIILIIGDSGSGKTHFCNAYAEEARQHGWQVGGIICPAVFNGQLKTAIEALDVASGERRLLATPLPGRPKDIPVGEWAIRPETLAWGNRIFQSVKNLDVLFVDELGPLEFFGGGGWRVAWMRLEQWDDSIQQGLVVVRPSLVEEARRNFKITREIYIKTK